MRHILIWYNDYVFNYYIFHIGTAFNLLFKILKPVMPKKAQEKTFVLDKNEVFGVLKSKLGVDVLEESMGGTRPNQRELENVQEYIKSGYWYSHRR